VNKEYSKNFTNELDFTTYSNYYNKANAEFLNLNKDLGVNRQLATLEIDFLEDKNNIKKFQTFLNNKNPLGKKISFKEAKVLLAKGGISLVDKSFDDYYKKILSAKELDDINIAKDFIKDNSNKNATVLLNNNKEIQLSILFRPTKEQYKDRYLGFIDYSNNEKFYDKYLYVKTTNDSNIFSTSSNIINGIIKPYEELGKALLESPLETAEAIGIGALNSIWDFIVHPIDTINDYALDNYDIYTKSKIDLLVGDKTAAEEKYGELANETVSTIMSFTGWGAGAKATKATTLIDKTTKNTVEKTLVKETNNSLLNKIDIDNKISDTNIANTVTKEIAEVGKNIIKLRDGTVINLTKPIKDIQIERANLIKELHKNKQGNLKIGEKTFSVNKEASNGKGVVFNERISDKEVERLFVELGGGKELPKWRKIRAKVRETGVINEGKLYTINNDKGKFNLREVSSSNLPNGEQPWTIDYIPNNDLEQRIELKFPRLQSNSKESD
ncbi:hypothetical protein, partial [Campylobacter sp. MG1]|uniref:hypothetical protein n=1 Tax=Campylobacter sp. MG1 TaxID=2976332 RepID=UPI00226C7826